MDHRIIRRAVAVASLCAFGCSWEWDRYLPNGLTPDAGGAGDARGFAGPSVPWHHGGPFATTMDTDHDGVPDAFDFYFGPGAYPPGV